MEEMESEDVTAAEQIYRPQDLVWVKISGIWWVAEVMDQATLDPEVTEGLKKQPLVVVKFLNEDTYEHIRSWNSINLYNCKRKEEFLKLGFKKYYKLKNEKNMAKFPEHIQEAERRTGGDPEIVNNPQYLPQEAQEPSKMEDGGRSSLPVHFKGKKATAPRRSAPAPSGSRDAPEDNEYERSDAGRPVTAKKGPTWLPYPKFIRAIFPVRKPPYDPSVEQAPVQRCCECCFETTNLGLFFEHYKHKQHDSSLIQPSMYRWRNKTELGKKKSGSGVKKTVVRRKKDSVPKPSERKTQTKTKKGLSPVPLGESSSPKKPRLTLPHMPSAHEVSQQIIEDWTDDFEEDTTAGIILSPSPGETTNEVVEGPSTSDSAPQKIDKPADPPKSSSCFDFAEEEPAGVPSSGKFGQIRLPRVITPEKGKQPDLIDHQNIESLLKQVSVPEIPSLPHSINRGERTYGSSPFRETKKPSATSLRSDANIVDVENNKNEDKHFLAEGPLQSKTPKRKRSGLTEGTEDGSVFMKKLRVNTSTRKPSHTVVASKDTAGESSKVAAELAKQSLIDTLTYSPQPDDQASLDNDSTVDHIPDCPIPLHSIPPSIEMISGLAEYDETKPESNLNLPESALLGESEEKDSKKDKKVEEDITPPSRRSKNSKVPQVTNSQCVRQREKSSEIEQVADSSSPQSSSRKTERGESSSLLNNAYDKGGTSVSETVIDGAPGDITWPPPSNRKSHRNQEDVPKPSVLRPDDDTSKADESIGQQAAKTTETEKVIVPIDSPAAKSREGKRGKSSSRSTKQAVFPQGDISKEEETHTVGSPKPVIQDDSTTLEDQAPKVVEDVSQQKANGLTITDGIGQTNDSIKSPKPESCRTQTGRPGSQCVLEKVELQQGEVSKAEDYQEAQVAESLKQGSEDECANNLKTGADMPKADESIINQGTQEPGKSTATEILEQTIQSPKAEESPRKDIIIDEVPAWAPLPSARRSLRNKMSGNCQETAELLTLPDDRTLVIDVQHESPQLGRRSKRLKSSNEPPELQSLPEAVTHESADSVKSSSSKQSLPSDIIQESVIHKPPRACRKSRKPKVQAEDDNLKVESIPEKDPLDVFESLRSPSREVTASISKGTTNINEPPRSSRRSQRNRSQEVPVSIPLPEDCLSKPVHVDQNIRQEHCESLKSQATDEASNISSQVSFKVSKASQPSRRSERINSQEVPVSIPLLDGDFKTQETASKMSVEISEPLKSLTTDEASHVLAESVKYSSKVNDSPKASKKSRKNTSTQGVLVCIPEDELPKDATSDLLILPKVDSSPRTRTKNKKSSNTSKLVSLPSDRPQKGDSVTHEDLSSVATTDFITPVVGDSPRTSKKTKKSSHNASKEESLPPDVPQKEDSVAQGSPRGAATDFVIPEVDDSSRSKNAEKSPHKALELESLPSHKPQEGDSVTHEDLSSVATTDFITPVVGDSPRTSKKTKKSSHNASKEESLPPDVPQKADSVAQDSPRGAATDFVIPEVDDSSRSKNAGKSPHKAPELESLPSDKPQEADSVTQEDLPKDAATDFITPVVGDSPRTSKKTKKSSHKASKEESLPPDIPQKADSVAQDSPRGAATDFVIPDVDDSSRSKNAEKSPELESLPSDKPQEADSVTQEDLPKDAATDFVTPMVGDSPRTSKKTKKSSHKASKEESLPPDVPQKADSVAQDSPRGAATDFVIPEVDDSSRSKNAEKSPHKAPELESLSSNKPQEADSVTQEDLPKDAATDFIIPKVGVSPRTSKRTKQSSHKAPELVSVSSDEPQKGALVTQEPQKDSEIKSSRRSRRRPSQDVSVSKSLCEVNIPKPETTASEMPQDSPNSTKQPSSNEPLTSKVSLEDVPLVWKDPELTKKDKKKEKSSKIPEGAPVPKAEKPSTAKVSDTETSDALGLQVVVKSTKEDSSKASSKKSKSVSRDPIEPSLLPEAVTPKMKEIPESVSLGVAESKSASRESKSKENERKATSKSHRKEKSPRDSRSASKEKNERKISPRRDTPFESRCVTKGDKDKSKVSPRQDTSHTDSRKLKRESNKKERKDEDGESCASAGEIHRKGSMSEKSEEGKSVEHKTDTSSHKRTSKRCRSSEQFDASGGKKVAADVRSLTTQSRNVVSDATPESAKTPQMPDLPLERANENAVGKLETGPGVMQPGTLGLSETLLGKNNSTLSQHPLVVCNETERASSNESSMIDSDLKQKGEVEVHSNLKEDSLVRVDEQFPEKNAQAMPGKNEPAQDVSPSDNLVRSMDSSHSEVIKDQVWDSPLVDEKCDTPLTTHENGNAMHQSPSQIPIAVAEKLSSPELCKEKVAKAAPSSPHKDEALNQISVTNDVFTSSSPRKKKSKWDIEMPKVDVHVTEMVEMGKDVESNSEAVKHVEENPPSGVKPLEITVSDCSKNEIVVDTEMAVSSPKKQMAHSPSKTLSRQDEAASLLEELLGSSPKSSPTSSPKKTKAVSPPKISLESPRRRSRTADIKFSLSPSKVLDFGSPAKANDSVESSTENPPLTPSKSPKSEVTHVLATPSRASRWDSPFPVKSTMPSQSVSASPTKAPRSPGKKVKVEIKSGLGRSCLKSSQGNDVVLETPKLPAHLEPDSSNNQSDDELSALQAEILSYSEMDKAKSTPVHEAKKEISDLAKELEHLPKSVQADTTAAVIPPAKKERGNNESSLSPNNSDDTKISHLSLEAIPLPPEPAPPKPSSLSEADLLASLDDTISIPLDEPITAESIRSLALETIASSKPVNAPIFITVPSDSVQGTDSAAVNIVGTERQTLGNGLAQGFGRGEDLLGDRLDINSIPIIMSDDLIQEENSIMTYPEVPATVSEPTSTTAVPPVATGLIPSIQLPSATSSEQHPSTSKITTAPRISSVATSGQVQTTLGSSITGPPAHTIELPPEPPMSEPPAAEEIETEIVMDHSENDQQNLQSPPLTLEEKFKQARLQQTWIRPELLDVMKEPPLPKMRIEAKRVNRIVMEIFSQHDPLYDYIMSQPMCQIGTTNYCPSWATRQPCIKLPPEPPPSTNPPKAVPSDAEPTSTSSNSVRQVSTTNASVSCQALSIDKTKHIVTVARPEKVGGEVVFADSSAKPLRIVGSQSVTVPANVSRQVAVSPSKPAAAQLKQNLMSLMKKAQSGELDAETARKLAAMTQNPDFMAKISKQKPVVSSRPSAEVKVQPRNAVPAGKTPIVRASQTSKIITSNPTGVSQPKPVVVAAASTPSQPKPNMLSAATGGTEPLKFTLESKFRNIHIANNSPKFVVSSDPVTGVPAVKQHVVVGRNVVPNATQPVSAGSSRGTILNTAQTGVVSPGVGRSTAPSTTPTFTVVSASAGRIVPTAAQTFTVVGSGPGRSPIPSTTQTFTLLNPVRPTVTSKAQQSTVNSGPSTVRAASTLPRPRLVQRVKTVPQPVGSNVVPARLTTQPQTFRVRKQTLPLVQPRLVKRPITKPETFTYVTLPNNMVLPTGSEQVLVVGKQKPPVVAPGSDILAKALADTDILPSDAEPFTQESSTDLFSPASVVIAGSLGTDQLPTISFDPPQSDSVNR